MLGTPVDVLPYVRGIQLILTGYSGYTKGKRKEADKQIRAEIIRAAGRVRSHMLNVQDSSYRDGDMDSTRAAKACIQEIDGLIEDVDKAPVGMDHAFLSGQRSASNSDLKKLIKHDHDVIEMVTKAVNISNSAEHALATSKEDVSVKSLVRQCEQMVSSCRGFFSARQTILAGLRQKKV